MPAIPLIQPVGESAKGGCAIHNNFDNKKSNQLIGLQLEIIF
jgi:hypothetical protein